MSKSNVVDLSGRDTDRDEPTELIRKGTRQLICQALEAEVSKLMTGFSGGQDARGRAAVVRNGYQPQRENPGGHWAGVGEGAEGAQSQRRAGWALQPPTGVGASRTRCCDALRPNLFSWAHMHPWCPDGPGTGETDVGATDPPVPTSRTRRRGRGLY